MSAAKFDFSIEQGSSFRLAFVYKDRDLNIVDLTDWCARLIWKTNKGEIHTFESGNNDSSYKFTIDGPNGKVELLIPSDITNTYDFPLAQYDLELQSPDDFYAAGGKYTVRVLHGVVTIAKRDSSTSTALDCIP